MDARRADNVAPKALPTKESVTAASKAVVKVKSELTDASISDNNKPDPGPNPSIRKEILSV